MRVLQWGKTALMWAAEGGHTEAINVLLQNGANAESKDRVKLHQFLQIFVLWRTILL